jgi:hypothetical protein
VRIARRVRLRLEQHVKVPERRLDKLVRRHLLESGRVCAAREDGVQVLIFKAPALQLTVVTICGSYKLTRPCDGATPSRLLRLRSIATSGLNRPTVLSSGDGVLMGGGASALGQVHSGASALGPVHWGGKCTGASALGGQVHRAKKTHPIPSKIVRNSARTFSSGCRKPPFKSAPNVCKFTGRKATRFHASLHQAPRQTRGHAPHHRSTAPRTRCAQKI